MRAASGGLTVVLAAWLAQACLGAGGHRDAAPPAGDAPAAWRMPSPALDYNARQGRALFRRYCATCHGPEGHGDGFNAFNLDPRPRDLADPEFQAERSDDDLAALIRSGGGAGGLSTGMPPWGRTLNERQIQDLVSYLRTLAGSQGPASRAD